jgi:DNA-binding transcriptional regulator GbsR (MarR family)
MCGKFGLNNIMAQLYAILYLSDKPLSLNDMVERLKISKGSASVNIRVLERYGVVRPVWVKGSRKDYYEAEADISKVIIERVRSMAQSRLTEVESMINASNTALNTINNASDEDKVAIDAFKERMAKLQAFHAQAKSMFDLFNMTLLGNAAAEEREETKETVFK